MTPKTLFLLTILLLGISTSSVHAGEPLATSGSILSAEGNNDPTYINLGKQSTGRSDVDLYSGSFTYNYPLEVPPGTNGLVP